MPVQQLDRLIDSVAKFEGYDGVKMMSSRSKDFTSKRVMQLSGIAMVPEARKTLDDRLQDQFDEGDGFGTPGVDEVIVGSGIHAATYAAARASRGFSPPLVLEAGERPGGSFAMSRRPTFRLNSRNRPGPLGEPGSGLGLNVIPGGIMQPSMLSTDEFQTNADLALAIRLTLAAFANVKTKSRVLTIELNDNERSSRRYRLRLDDGSSVYADRVLDARGLGKPLVPNGFAKPDGKKIFTFFDFVRHLDKPFPLRGMRRVAVVGNGDSAKCTVEALLGIGPSQLSVPELDFVEQIDWYGPGLSSSPRRWVETQRCRYASIGAFLPRVVTAYDNDDNSVVPPRTSRLKIFTTAGAVSAGVDTAFVNGEQYEAVIMCVGYEPYDSLTRIGPVDDQYTGPLDGDSEQAFGRRLVGQEIYEIGPRARLPFSSVELNKPFARIAQNSAAIFRLVGKTAGLAVKLGRP